MAEFENGFCTGCGIKVLRWGHRPYCWRKVSMMLDVHPTHDMRQRLLREMEKNWRFLSLLLVRRRHMYYQVGDPPNQFGPTVLSKGTGE